MRNTVLTYVAILLTAFLLFKTPLAIGTSPSYNQTPFPTLELQQSCASITDCNGCYNTLGCHFCDYDSQCHAYGSIFGCLIGASCTRPECIRQAPERLGVQYPPVKFVFGVLAGFTLLFFLFTLCLNCAFYGTTILCWCCPSSQPNSTNELRGQSEVIVLHAGETHSYGGIHADHQHYLPPTHQITNVTPPPPTNSNSTNHGYSEMEIEESDQRSARWYRKSHR